MFFYGLPLVYDSARSNRWERTDTMKTKRVTKPRRRRGIKRRRTWHWRGTDITVTYKGLDHEKDRAIRKAIGKYDTGSGFLFSESERDLTATVPEDDLARVLRELKKIRGIRTKKLVQKWVLCR
jgi:hypothetical protein